MRRSFVRSSFLGLPLVLGPFAAAASAQAPFDVVSISVPPNSVWQINRPIEIEFSAIVDFTTVNPNTVQVRSAGIPAPGTLYSIEPRRIGFQPDCPRAEDASDAGFLPGGVAYTLFLPGSGSGMPTVLSQSGRELVQSHQVDFVTPVSTLPSVLFFDAVPGAPRPVIRTSATQLDASLVRIGEDPLNLVYFQPRSPADPALGADLPAGFEAPLNLYSTPETRVEVEIQLNQSIDGTPSNVNPERVLLEYRTGPATWAPLLHEVELVLNCTPSGAVVRVAPIGILPQGRIVRVVLASSFTDIVGQTRPAPLVVGSFVVTTAVDPGTTTPGDAGDEVLEEFRLGGGGPGSREDPSALRRHPGAVWGEGRLAASLSAFGGTGGPGGDFDWQVGNDPGGAPETLILDTTFTIIHNAQNTATEAVINGLIDVRNVAILATGTVVVIGPNPCRILASGAVRIEGKIVLRGNNNLGVATINTTYIPEPGATGQAGGGRGGTGSYLTTQSTPAGETGFGAFNVPGAGGVGGEAGFYPGWPGNQIDEFRRPGGGGGGTLGSNLLRPAGIAAGYTNPNLCPDQVVIGLDAENGFNGYPGAIGVLSNAMPPLGGIPGPRPFFDGDPTNDFWGTMRTQGGQLIRGELLQPWAGAGGGGGGDAIVSNSFPTTPFDPGGDEKGAGGGAGGGSFSILALGPITFGASGRIDASGGTGGPGENSEQTGGITHIGGGSGGGSGGHVVLESADRIDLSQCRSTGTSPGGIYALGGNGGAGKDNLGGARPGGIPAAPQHDALPPNSYPNTSAPCGVVSGQAGYTFSNSVGATICAGGDGGPGIVQLHAPTLADILTPSTIGENIYKIVKPPPVGSFPAVGVPSYSTINDPPAWDQLVPAFGRKSEAVSKWIALGSASVDPASSLPDAVRFLFAGTGGSGDVLTIGSGAGATVADLPPIFAGAISGSPLQPPYVAADARTLVLDGTTLPDDLYLRTPALLRRFSLELTHGARTTEFEVGSATYDASTHELRLTVSTGGMPLAVYVAGDAVALSPRFFRVATDGVVDSLPASARIRIEFQATTQDLLGNPDTGASSPWRSELAALDPNVPPNPDYRFLRFRVAFDLAVDGSPLTPQTPVPSLDFVRIPFRF